MWTLRKLDESAKQGNRTLMILYDVACQLKSHLKVFYQIMCEPQITIISTNFYSTPNSKNFYQSHLGSQYSMHLDTRCSVKYCDLQTLADNIMWELYIFFRLNSVRDDSRGMASLMVRV